ncbi:MAG: flagellar protein FlaG [Geminicoccaceae bacterium]
MSALVTPTATTVASELRPPPPTPTSEPASRLQTSNDTPGVARPAAQPTAGSDLPQAVQQAAARAVRDLYREREVAIESFRDEGTGRLVYRVTDQRTGELLTQTPPDELLRFWAASQDRVGDPPLLDVAV